MRDKADGVLLPPSVGLSIWLAAKQPARACIGCGGLKKRLIDAISPKQVEEQTKTNKTNLTYLRKNPRQNNSIIRNALA